MYDNQKQIDEIEKHVNSICSGLGLSSFSIEGNTVIGVCVMLPVKGNSEVIRKLESIGFRKLYRQKSAEAFNSGYASSRYKGYSMYQKMSMNLNRSEEE